MKKCTVIGGGAMGRQIALNTAIHGYDVVVCESFPAALASLESWKEEYLAGRVAKGRMTQEHTMERIEGTEIRAHRIVQKAEVYLKKFILSGGKIDFLE